MIYNILAVGDVVGACGVKHLSRCLRSLKKLQGATISRSSTAKTPRWSA